MVCTLHLGKENGLEDCPSMLRLTCRNVSISVNDPLHWIWSQVYARGAVLEEGIGSLFIHVCHFFRIIFI